MHANGENLIGDGAELLYRSRPTADLALARTVSE
jgi:hypothetical protein